MNGTPIGKAIENGEVQAVKKNIKLIPSKVLRIAKKNGLTMKQTGFVADIIEHKNGTRAARDNYEIEAEDKDNTAKAIAGENLSKPTIQKTITEILADNGLNQDNIIGFHRDLRDNSDDNRIKMETNRDFLKISGVLRQNDTPTGQINVQINQKIEKMNINEVENDIMDLLKERE